MTDPFDVFRMGLPRARRGEYAAAMRATTGGQLHELERAWRRFVRALARGLAADLEAIARRLR